MKEHPILFSGPMVRAILEERKTVTRRALTPQLPADTTRVYPIETLDFSATTGLWAREWRDRGRPWTDNVQFRCPYGRPGDRLWVRETFYCDSIWYPEGEPDGITSPPLSPEQKRAGMLDEFYYRADGEDQIPEPEGKIRWRPSIFLPRWASRLTLEVVSVRVERVQDITEVDAIAEGVQYPVRRLGAGKCAPLLCLTDKFLTPHLPKKEDITHQSLLRAHFAGLWDSINAKRGVGWSSNPWVWVVEFRRVGRTDDGRTDGRTSSSATTSGPCKP